jgi:hypothetical protein
MDEVVEDMAGELGGFWGKEDEAGAEEEAGTGDEVGAEDEKSADDEGVGS